MKPETLIKLKSFIDSGRIEFTEKAINFDLTDKELKDLVELEYGQTSQDVVQLFTVMCKKLVNLALENGNV